MFGYVRPSMGRLSEEERERFSALYCGLCRRLGQRYGTAARFILNYDFTFLAALLSPPEGLAAERRRCMAHPVKGRACALGGEAIDLAADCSVILAWWQLQDGIRDKDGVKYRAAALALGPAYRKARVWRPGFDRDTQARLEELARLEAERCPSMDRPADAFARLLSGIGREVDEPVKARVLEQMLYHLGRWIYLVDAMDDLKADFAGGSYNPLIHRFGLRDGELTEEARRDLVLTLDHSIRQIAAAYELWDFGVWSPIVRATVYEGLFLVGKAVLEGRFQAAPGFRISGREEEPL